MPITQLSKAKSPSFPVLQTFRSLKGHQTPRSNSWGSCFSLVMLQGCEGWPSLAQPQTSPAGRTAHNLLLLLGVGAPSPVSIGVPAEPSVPGSPQTPPSPPRHPHTATSLRKQGQHSQEEERNPRESSLRSYAESSLLAASTTSMFQLPAVGLSHPLPPQVSGFVSSLHMDH